MAKRRRKPLTVQDMARQGGAARMKQLTAEGRRALARKAALARWKKAE
jgi:hypothetical protein